VFFDDVETATEALGTVNNTKLNHAGSTKPYIFKLSYSLPARHND